MEHYNEMMKNVFGANRATKQASVAYLIWQKWLETKSSEKLYNFLLIKGTIHGNNCIIPNTGSPSSVQKILLDVKKQAITRCH